MKDKDKKIVGEPISFAIRALDFNPETKTLYTGDEMGYLQVWNLKPLLEKLEDAEKQAESIKANIKKGSDTTKVNSQVTAFLTDLLEGEESKFT